MFIHAVLMSFTPGTSEDFHREVESYAVRIRQECEGVVSYLYGTNEASRAGGYTHAVVASFTDESAHEVYQVSVVHQDMKAFMATRIDQLVVFDSTHWP